MKVNIKLVLVTMMLMFRIFAPNVYAQENVLKDTDLDGVSDNAETSVYKTDPKNPDTDNDGVLDFQEILDGTNPNDENSSKLVDIREEKKAFISTDIPVMWYVGRISGIVSFILFTLVICFGLLMTSKILLKFRFIMPGDALTTHMFLSTYLAFFLLILHISAFVFDDFFQLKLHEVFVPFLLRRDIESAIGVNIGVPVALGVIAFYLAIVLLVTSLFRNKIVSNITWRKIHYSSFLFYLLFLVHAYTAGTDSQEPWMVGIYITSVVLVLGLVLLRIFGKKYFLPKPKPRTVSQDSSISSLSQPLNAP